MQPLEERRGVSIKSQLFDSLKVYLNNKNRLQPIIGLSSIIECMKAGSYNREGLYLCEVCVCRLSKADIRNHIMGSLHRYNYIKAWHPVLVSEWKVNSDLSKLAWPLMEIAKLLEGKEGPGDVQLLEVEDAVYQRMATCSESDAVTLINILRDGQGQGESESYSEDTSEQLEHYPIQSQRIVFLAQNQQFKKSLQSSTETNKPPSLIQSTVAPSVESEDWLNNTSTSLLNTTQGLPEPSVLSENGNSFLDAYAGTKPLIGLSRVVECRSEDGHTYCFLCHCCRIKSNKKDIIDHLTSASHLMNYLTETHPEQVEVMMADFNDNHQLLQSLAKKVEQQEGRGELKVVNAPESLCIVLTGKSYHWCLKMLCNGWTHKKIQKRKIAVKGPSVNKTSDEVMTEKSEWVKRTKTKRKKMRKPVFKVSLPLTKGSVLLERTSFSMDSLVSSEYSPPSDCDLNSLPDSQSEDSELDCDTGSFTVNHTEHTSMCSTSQLQQDLCCGVAVAGQYMEPGGNFVSRYHEVDGYFSDNEYSNQSEYLSGTKDPWFYGEKNPNRLHNSQERLTKRFHKKSVNEGPQTQNEWPSLAVSITQDWSPYNSSYRREEGCTEQWYSSISQSNVGTKEERQKEMSSNATHYYNQQKPQNQDMTDSVGPHGLSGELAPYLDPTWIDMHPHLGVSLALGGNIAPENKWMIEQRQWETYMEFTTGRVQTAPQSSVIQPTAPQVIHIGHGVVSNTNYNTGPVTNSDQHFHHPSVIWSPRLS